MNLQAVGNLSGQAAGNSWPVYAFAFALGIALPGAGR